MIMNKWKVAEWSKAADCKSVTNSLVGSNPTLPTCVHFDFVYSLLYFGLAYSSKEERSFDKRKVDGSSPSKPRCSDTLNL